MRMEACYQRMLWEGSSCVCVCVCVCVRVFGVCVYVCLVCVEGACIGACLRGRVVGMWMDAYAAMCVWECAHTHEHECICAFAHTCTCTHI